MATDLHQLSLTEAAELVRGKRVSPVELTQACLQRVESLDPRLNAFISVTPESALREARDAEAAIQGSEYRGVLHGIPIALKDLIDVAGRRTTGGSAIFGERVAELDAELVRNLRAAGAVLLGKTNLHELAYGGSSAVSAFGPVHNPWDVERSPGGSSGGSAAAVAAGMCYGAVGSDTGGSIRQPAGYCGIMGLKPTFGRVSTHGVIPLSWTLDHMGPMTRTVADAAVMLDALAGTRNAGVALAGATNSLRAGVPRDYFCEGLDPEVQLAFEAALEVIRRLTRELHDVLPLTGDPTYKGLMKTYSTVFSAEAHAIHEQAVAQTPELFQPLTLKRLRAAAGVTASAYIHARREIERLRQVIAHTFEQVDMLIIPTAAVPPFRIAELMDAESARGKELQMLRNTRPINALGVPAISIPCGFTSAGLPIGMQIIGAPGADDTVMGLAHAYEQATDWHKRRPCLE